MMKELSECLFFHKAFEEIAYVEVSRVLVGSGDKTREDYIETIDAAKYLLNEFLDQVLGGAYNLNNFPYDKSLIREFRERADFDWEGGESFRCFYEWIHKTFFSKL